MSKILRSMCAVLMMAWGGATVASEPVSVPSCQPQTVGDVSYTICSVDPAIGHLTLFWKTADGEPYKTFSDLAKALTAEGKTLSFAMNAGMYDQEFSPMGLYVEGGKELHPANTVALDPSDGVVPNFYKKPNGVFFLDEKGPAILPTDVFLKRIRKPVFATQSGPMLVIDGKLNPIFIPGSTDRKRRSGVGVCEGGMVRFAISDDPVNFHDFGTLFRDDLKCANALFLDGGRGAGMFVPALAREDTSGHGGYGPMIGLVE